MSTKHLFLLLLFFGVLLETIGDVLIKKWVLSYRGMFLIFGLIFYFAGSAFWIFSLKYDYLSRAITIFTILNLLALVLFGIYLFDEHLSIINKFGIGLALLSVVLVEW